MKKLMSLASCILSVSLVSCSNSEGNLEEKDQISKSYSDDEGVEVALTEKFADYPIKPICDFNNNEITGSGEIVHFNPRTRRYWVAYQGENGRRRFITSRLGDGMLARNCAVKFNCDFNQNGETGTAEIDFIGEKSWQGTYTGELGKEYDIQGKLGDGSLKSCRNTLL